MLKPVYINAATAIHAHGIVSDDGIMHAALPGYKDLITNANQRRRMSHIVKMGVASGLLCLQEMGDDRVDAIITATGLGCLANTEKFLSNMIDNDEQLLNPTAFIQSTFNVIGAQIALLTNNHAYNNTYVHRGLSFETALLDAHMRINEGDKNVLVGTADEATLSTHTVMKRLGLLQNVTMGEGAQFFVLSQERSDNSYVQLINIKTYTGALSASELRNKIDQFLSINKLNTSDIEILMTGDNGHIQQDAIYKEVKAVFAEANKLTFKEECGEYHTASSYAMYKAVNHLKDKEPKAGSYLLIYNHYNLINHSLILLRSCR